MGERWERVGEKGEIYGIYKEEMRRDRGEKGKRWKRDGREI